MFLRSIPIETDRIAALLTQAERAARAVPPAFPLTATVAVNPFMGHAADTLARTAARQARATGARIVPDRTALAAALADGRIASADIDAALADVPEAAGRIDRARIDAALAAPRAASAPAAVPTVADLAAGVTGIDWPEIVSHGLGLWAGGRFDTGQALWTPAPGLPAYAAWRQWATHDLAPEIAGLTGFSAFVAAAPDTADRAIARACATLGLDAPAAGSVFDRLFADLGGWAQHARWLLWQAELSGETDSTMTDLLAIRLVWEEALFLAHRDKIAAAWDAVRDRHAAPAQPDDALVIDTVLQTAAERGFQRRLAATLTGAPAAPAARPALQAAFCIDVRSEVFRRHLEGLDGAIETIGFAGFFGLPVAHRPAASDLTEAHLPVLLSPGLTTRTPVAPEADMQARIKARAARAWGRFRQAAVSSFAFVEAAGPVYAGKLLRDALALSADPVASAAPAPVLDPGLSADAKADTGAAVLRAMSLTTGHARLIVLAGHGAQTTNNPHASAYHCGACGGHTGEVSARVLAALLNDPETRAGLPARGIDLPADTLFVAALHDTATDVVTLWADAPAATHADDLARARDWLAQAGALARTERAARLPGARPDTLAARAANWAETRPEWGLAGCAAFIAAPRAATAGRDLGGRAFLHSYDWRADTGFATLELILTAPVVVASWISLQYYASAVAPRVWGAGDKLLHNVVGGIGVIEGNAGPLRTGLPWQAVHDGAGLAHDPLRLAVLVEAPRDAMDAILARHDGLRALFDNGWLSLLAMQDGRVTHRYRAGGGWRDEAAATV